ncbi:MAG: hypothetical protein WKG07_13030 [Hymenobacter sp.]
MSKGEEERGGGRKRAQLLANAIEALIGAIYLDQGYQATERFVRATLVVRLPEIIEGNLDRDPQEPAAGSRPGKTRPYAALPI